jgi:hypothetical protein
MMSALADTTGPIVRRVVQQWNALRVSQPKVYALCCVRTNGWADAVTPAA